MDTPHLQELLDVHPWEDAFDDRTLSRGSAYYHGDRVMSLRHQPGANTDTLLGVVRGSTRQPYSCVIQLSVHQRELRMASSCTCPMGAECKHVVAVLMMATNTPSEFWPDVRKLVPLLMQAHGLTPPAPPPTPVRDPLREWTHWLQTVASNHAPVSAFAADAERQFAVLLRGTKDDAPPRLLINLVWLRRLRPGRSTSGKAKPGSTLVDPQPLLLDPLHGPVRITHRVRSYKRRPVRE